MDLGKDKWKQALLLGAVVLATAVIVGGGTYYYIEQKNDKTVADLKAQLDTQSLSSSISSQSSSSVSSTKSLYESKDYGFSFEYPKDWIVTKADDVIYINTPTNDEGRKRLMSGQDIGGGYHGTIQLGLYESFAAFKAQYKERSENLDSYIRNNGDNKNIADVTFGGVKAFEFEGPGMGGTYYNIMSDYGKFLMLSILSDKKNLTQEQKDIITSFKIDETLAWKKAILDKLGLSMSYPAEWGDISATANATTEDPTYVYSFSNNKGISLGYSTGKVTVGRGGGFMESYFWKEAKDTANLITEDNKVIGGIFSIKGSSESADAPALMEDTIFATYFKTGSMYSNIVLQMPDSAANKVIAEKVIKSIK